MAYEDVHRDVEGFIQGLRKRYAEEGTSASASAANADGLVEQMAKQEMGDNDLANQLIGLLVGDNKTTDII